jgi:hypothetical protein
MAMKLDQVVPFGRSLDEYIKMFELTPEDLQKSILGVGDGPASFNAEGTGLGYRIKSVDPLYVFSATQIQERFDAVVDNIIEQVRSTPGDWDWTYHESPGHLRANRERSTALFCADFESGCVNRRYEVGELPHLPYQEGEFELGLCSHLLFLYSAQLDQQFHLKAVREMLRVCHEVRIFPLLTLMLDPSPHLDVVIEALQAEGFTCQVQQVSYCFQRNGNQMLKIQRQ